MIRLQGPGGPTRRMAGKPEFLPDELDAGGSGFLAEEDDLDRRSLWRLASWGVGAVAAVVVAVMASRSSIAIRHDQIAAADLARQSQQIASVAKESQSEARRLASAIDTLNSDRDRLYSRVTVLEQGLDSVTGSIAKANSTAATARPGTSDLQAAAPVASAPATTAAALAEKPRDSGARQPDPGSAGTAAPAPATPLVAAKSMMAPPDAAASKLVAPEQPPEIIRAAPETAVAALDSTTNPADAEVAVQRTEFGVDLGGADSIEGLRALWRGALKSNVAALAGLRPIIVLKEQHSGPGMQLRLVAGPLGDAAAAAKICAAFMETQRPCETTVFDGQRLAMKTDDAPAAARPAPRKRAAAKRPASVDQQLPKPKQLTPPPIPQERQN
jgi:hypothetical protein